MSGTLLPGTPLRGTPLLSRAHLLPRGRQHSATSAATSYRPAVAAPMMVVLAFAVAAPVSILFAAAGEGTHPLVMLVLIALAAFGVGLFGDLPGALAAGLVFWMFFDGFDLHRSGVLGWDGRTDALRLGVLLAAGLLGAAVGYVRYLYRIRRPGAGHAR